MTTAPTVMKAEHYAAQNGGYEGQESMTEEGISVDEEASKEDIGSRGATENSCLVENLDNCCGDGVRGVRDCACCLRQGTREVYEGCRSINYGRLARNTFNLRNLKAKFPILKWLPKYRLNYAVGDFIAGLTVGLAQLPKSLAMAKIADLPPQYGIYSATFCVFVYIFFGTCKDMNLGPQSVQSLIVSQFGKSPIDGDASHALALSLMCGLVQFAMGVFRLGFLVNYISYPVLESFTTASVIIVAYGQVPSWLGLKGMPRPFLEQVYWTFRRLPEVRLWDFLLGLVSMVVIFLMQKMATTTCLRPKFTSKLGRAVKYTVWLCSISRMVVVVIIGIVVAYVFHLNGHEPFSLTKDIPPGLPPFKPPSFSVTDGNITYTAKDIFEKMAAGVIFAPIISYISVMAIAKNFARKGNYKVDKDQELIALGVANVAGSFLSAFPITGTFSGSAVNYQSGARSPLNGLVVGILGVLVLLFLTPVFYYIPNASLSSVIIMSVVDMINFGIVIKLWNVKKLDLIPWLVTFVLCLAQGIQYGIIAGIALSICILIFPVSRPKVLTEDLTNSKISLRSSPESDYAILVIQQGLAFPSVEYFVDTVMNLVLEGEKTCMHKSVILDFVHVPSLDFSIVQGLEELTNHFKDMEITLILCRVRPSVQKVITRCGIKNFSVARDAEEAIELLQRNRQKEGTEEEEEEEVKSNGVIFAISNNSLNAVNDSFDTSHLDTSSSDTSGDSSNL